MCIQRRYRIEEDDTQNHPFVEDAEEELRQIDKEEEENAKKEELVMYGDAFNSSKEKGQKDQQEVEDV